ncbi:MAG: Co2+/Mg2+ efflux protein ApaG [Mariprofundaceae bacterium]
MSDAYQIEVTVLSEYIPDQSEPDEDRYVFAYHITVRNRGRVTAQLISRHWLISDANDQVDEVRGEGVVGEQPLIAPGGEHHYSSFSILETAVGMMQGSYQMIAEDGTAFKAEIPAFTLAVPGSLN